MKKNTVLILCMLLCMDFVTAQNVGIGTTTPRGPLSFPPLLGQKIILWDDGNAAGNNYGIGVQSGSLQLHTYTVNDDVVFGYGKSAAFSERMRIINNGGDGLDLKGRISLRNGTSPINNNYGPGIWLFNSDNTGQLGFIGTQNNSNIGFFGGPAGWGLTYNALNSRVGIGNDNPNAPLSFPATLEKKITLYPGNTGDVGFGVSGNRLQIYVDNPNADVAIGYDAAGTFNERFAVKANGALAVNGNMGSAGQVLTSNGSGVPATWTNPGGTTTVGAYNFATQSAISADLSSSSTAVDLPAMVANFTLNTNATVVFNYRARINNRGCFGCGERRTFILLRQNISGGTTTVNTTVVYTPNGEFADGVSGPFNLNLGPGIYSYKLSIENSIYGTATVYSNINNYNILSWQIFPQ